MEPNQAQPERKTETAFIYFAVIHLAAVFAFPWVGYAVVSMHAWMSLPAVSLIYYLAAGVLPVIGYIVFAERQPVMVFLGMRTHILPGMGAGFIIGAAVFAIFFAVNRGRIPEPEQNRTWVFMTGTALVAFLEEIPFRGFYLKKISRIYGFAGANIITSVLFAALHIPALLMGGAGVWMPIILLFVISLWLGYIYKKTRSLWSAVVIHMAYNLAVYLFS